MARAAGTQVIGSSGISAFHKDIVGGIGITYLGLSEFVVPGAYRIDSNNFNSGRIEDVAFQNPDGSIVLFVLNAGSAAQAFTVDWKNTYFNYTLSAQSVATFAW